MTLLQSEIPLQRRERLAEYIRENCIFYDNDFQPIFSKGGKRFTWIFDLRPLLLDGQMLQLAAELFWERMGHLWPFQVAGIELTAVPLLGAIIVEGARQGRPTTALVVRQKRKKTGRNRLVEGSPDPDLPVVLIDDTVNSADGINKALVAVNDLYLKAVAAFTLISFKSRLASLWEKKNGLAIGHVFIPQDFNLPLSSATPILKTDFSIAWTFQSPRPNYGFAVAKSQPLIYQDSIMFGSDGGYFRCLERETGRVKWRHKVPDKTRKGIISSPLIVDGNVYFGGYCGGLYCLNASTGEVVWKKQACDWIGSSPCYANGHIFIGLEYAAKGNQGSIGKFCARTGELKGAILVKRQLHGSPVYSEAHDTIVLGTNDSTVMAINPNGSVRQTLKVGGPVKYHCALYDNLAVFGSFDGKIYVWDFVNNEVRLTVQTDDIVYSRALIVGDRAFMGSADHTVHVIDLKEMRKVWQFDAKEKVHSSPALIRGTVFVGTSSGELIGLDPVKLKLTHSFRFPERITTAAVADDKRLFVYAYDNKLWAIEPEW